MRKRFLAVEKLEQTAREAIVGGYGIVLTWDEGSRDRHAGMVRRKVLLACSMDCTQPVIHELHARDSAWHGRKVAPLILEVHSRCRKCDECRRRRAMFWAARATAEFNSASRTIFGTLTTTPERDVYVDALARLSLSEKGVDFDRLGPVDQFRERTRYAGLEITKYLKRLREGDARRGKADFRYLLIAEAHDSAATSDAKRGRPHWHVLFHEKEPNGALALPDEWAVTPDGLPATDKYGNPYLTKTAFLKKQWNWGHSSFALCRSPQAAAYLCKYLTKSETPGRVRASFRYGGTAADLPAGEAGPPLDERQGENSTPLKGEVTEWSWLA